MRSRAVFLVAVTVALNAAGLAPARAQEAAPAVTSESEVFTTSETFSSSAAVPEIRESGTATWYGPGFDGQRTASGAEFSSQALTAAHKSLPFGTRVRVTALDTLASVVVTINDRLPDASRHIIDVSRAAGRILRMLSRGVARVRIEIVD